MDRVTGDRLVEVAQVWALATGDEVDDSLLDSIRDHESFTSLADTPDEVLLEAALVARKPGEWRTWTLPLREWERAVHAINLTAAGSSLRPGAFEYALLPRLLPTTPMDVAARQLLEARAKDRSIHDYFGDLGRHRRLAVHDVPGLRHLDEDEVETAAAMLLVRVAPTGSFSSTGTGQVFIDWHTGYHLDEERTYITGLSVGIDHARDCLDGHRHDHWPPGGQFSVDGHGKVICALCHQSVGTVTSPIVSRQQSGCPGPRPA